VNESHRPIPGKLYRIMNYQNDHMRLFAFEGPARIYGTEFEFNPKEGFLFCLPRREDLSNTDMFLVSGTIHVIVWNRLQTKCIQDWVWLEEVIDTDVE